MKWMDQDQGTQHANKNNNHINQQVNGKSIKITITTTTTTTTTTTIIIIKLSQQINQISPDNVNITSHKDKYLFLYSYRSYLINYQHI